MIETATRQVSLATKIKQITGLAGTISVDAKTNQFLEGLELCTDNGRILQQVGPEQCALIDRIWSEHFA